MNQKAVIIAPGAGPVFSAFGDTVVSKLSAADTGGKLSLVHVTTPPDGGPPLHRHTTEDEMFIIISGRFRFVSDGVESEGGPGTIVWLPRGTVHTYTVAGDEPGQAWVIVLPGGFETFFRTCAEVFASAAGGPPDLDRIGAAAAEHGIEIVGPPLAAAG